MTLPDARRLLQVVFAVVVGDPDQHAIDLSDWRQQRNATARKAHAKARRRAHRQWLRDTG